jgi:hypothetical protein
MIAFGVGVAVAPVAVASEVRIGTVGAVVMVDGVVVGLELAAAGVGLVAVVGVVIVRESSGIVAVIVVVIAVQKGFSLREVRLPLVYSLRSQAIPPRPE